MTIPHRRVRIAKDSVSPCWFITCVEPCEPGGCQVRPDGKRLCWLGGASTKERAVKLALRNGYAVSGAGEPSPAAAGAADGKR